MVIKFNDVNKTEFVRERIIGFDRAYLRQGNRIIRVYTLNYFFELEYGNVDAVLDDVTMLAQYLKERS